MMALCCAPGLVSLGEFERWQITQRETIARRGRPRPSKFNNLVRKRDCDVEIKLKILPFALYPSRRVDPAFPVSRGIDPKSVSILLTLCRYQ